MDIEKEINSIKLSIKGINETLLALATRQGNRANEANSGISTLDSRADASDAEMLTKCANDNVSSTWDEITNYVAGFYVINDDKLYKCLIDNYGIKPSTDPIHWKLTNVVDELNALNNIVKEN